MSRKGSEASNNSLSSVLISVEVETWAERDYVPGTGSLPLGLSSSISLPEDFQTRADIDSKATEANPFHPDSAELANLGQVDWGNIASSESSSPLAERRPQEVQTGRSPSQLVRDSWRQTTVEAAAAIRNTCTGSRQLEQVGDDADQLDRRISSRGRYSSIEPSCAQVLYGEESALAL